ncbi:MAG: DNA mismatch repair endonuclease MutL [Treponema sp.]|jgi:DNA mismatch repair protein MutL|nr:DNA mismatch repair endonuclease MutL [Treponema sp.]
MDIQTRPGKIRLLPPEEARKIAAGEVIDRPAALVRELLDNAIDAGGRAIETAIEGGGIRKTEVSDDGEGMEKEDLELCCRTHATSKIRSLEDLERMETLGFRGEALAAAAAVSRIEILTSVNGRGGWLLTSEPGNAGPALSPASRAKGSSVRALGLFDTIPARKQFLKREAAEGSLCRQACLDKALAFPRISFRLLQDGQLKLLLPPAASFKDRFVQALLGKDEGAFIHEIAAQGPGLSVVLVVGGPELFRTGRRQQYIMANGRRIQDYSLLKALECGLQGWFPNGTHPVGAIFVDIDPALADFNIHPAKREVRFRDPGAVHHAVAAALRDFARRYVQSGFADRADSAPPGGPKTPGGGLEGKLALEALLDHPPAFAALPRKSLWAREAPEEVRETASYPAFPELPLQEAGRPISGGAPRSGELRLAGRLFKLFILVEWRDRLFIIDQHAAHERLLYDRLLASPIPKQELLVPIRFETQGEAEDQFLTLNRETMLNLGIVIHQDGAAWRIEALPAAWRLSDAETVQAILSLKNTVDTMAERWAATLSCHQAIRDGDYLDDAGAADLAAAVLGLADPRCPHGRPIWAEVSRETLCRAVRRL